MQELMKINCEHERITLSGRELHEFLEIGTEYAKWISRMFEYGFTENIDYLVIVKNDENHLGGRPSTDHQLTIEMAKEIAMVQRSEKGKQARTYFIELEKKWNSPEAVMARALKMANNKLLSLQQKVEEDKPKVLFADAVSASNTTILIGELAKLLKQNGIDIGEKRLFEWLRAKGYLISRKGTDYNAPTQKSMELGLFAVKETAITHSDGHTTVNKTTKVTGSGQQYFINKFLTEKSKLN